MIKQREPYTATQGVDNEGYDYERSMLAFYCLKLCYNKDIENFRVAIYDKEYHPFDDIVLEVTTVKGTENYAIQLKHVKDNLSLNANHFNKNGKMFLGKYFKFDFTKCENVLLFTNGVVENDIEVGSCQITQKTSLSQIEETLNTSCKEIYEIYNKDTLQRITFFTRQKNCHEIDDAIKNFLKERFYLDDDHCVRVVENFKTFLGLWKKKLVKLDKEDIKVTVAEILFLEHFFNYHPQFKVETDKKVQLLQRVVNSFTISVVTDVESDVVDNLCSFALKEEDLLKSVDDFLVYDISKPKVIARILWKQKKFPLVLRVTKYNENIIASTISTLKNERLSFLLIGSLPEEFREDAVFEKLMDLQDRSRKIQPKHDVSFFEEVCQQFKLSLQGQPELSLKELLDLNPRFSNIITTKELLTMAKGTLVVGDEEEKLPEPYVPRRLTTDIIKTASLNDFPGEVFAISGCSKFLRKHLPKFKLIKFHEFETQFLNKCQLPLNTIILCEDSESNFMTCLKYQHQNVHCLKTIDEDHLQLIYKNPSDKLRERQVLEEKDLHKILKCNINLVCAGPSMGKATMLKCLRKNCPPGYWTTKVDRQEKIEPKTPDALFFSEVVSCLQEVRKRIYFYTGIDNLQNNELIQVTEEIKRLAQDNFKVWVFAGNILKERLEKLFGVVAMEIKEFTEEEQKSYIRQRLQVEGEKLQTVLNTLKVLKSNDILGAPMHLYMLTEIFIKHPNLFSDNKLCLNDIFHHFIKTKYEYYLSRSGSELPNKIIDDGIYYRTEQYKLAAISSLNIRFLDQQCDTRFSDQIQKMGDVVEIISKIGPDSRVIFCEESYRDYFAALWLSENFNKVKHLDELLFNEKYKNLVFLFNLEICKTNPAHIAVIYKDIEDLKKISRNEIKEVDPLDRSVVDLACFYGERYPKLIETEKTVSLKMMEKDLRSREIIKYLLDNVTLTPEQINKVVESAYKTFNLFALENILAKYEQATLKLKQKLQKDTERVPRLVFYSVRDYYANLLKIATTLESFPNILTMQTADGNVFHLATKISSFDIIKMLLDAGVSSTFPTSTYHRRSPLHLAVERQDLAITKLLVQSSENIDVLDRHRLTPLHLASESGDLEAVKLLLDSGADINFGDNFGRTPLHLAAQNKHKSVVTLLQERGAKSDLTDKLGNKPFDGFVWPERWTKM